MPSQKEELKLHHLIFGTVVFYILSTWLNIAGDLVIRVLAIPSRKGMTFRALPLFRYCPSR